MARLYGRAPRGERCRAAVPWPWENHHLHCRAALRRHRCAHGPRRPDERRGLSRLCRTGTRSRVATSRHRHHGHLPAHKSPPRQTSDRGHRREPAIPAAIQPRLQSHRNGLRQTQGPLRPAAARTIPDLWQAIANAPRCFRPARMRQLSRRRRIRCDDKSHRPHSCPRRYSTTVWHTLGKPWVWSILP